MDYTAKIKLTLLHAFIIPLTYGQSVLGCDEDQIPLITVNGSAEVRVSPDEAVLTFSVESREESIDATVKDNDAKIRAVIAFLRQSKVESKHIRTQVITIRPIFADPEPKWKGQSAQIALPNANAPAAIINNQDKPSIKPIGYTARRQLSLIIKDLSTFEAIYRGLIERGVNDVGGIQFRTTELRKHKDEARLKAVRAAKEKATAMAKELGASIWSVQSITEDSGPRYSNFAQNVIATGFESSGDGNSIAAGMIEVKASVRVVFRLADTEID